MKSNWMRGSAAVLMTALALGLAACSSAPTTAPTPELQQQIGSAKTRADHEALVAYYERQAATAREYSERHRKLAGGYQGYLAGGRGGGAGMTAHCNRLADSYAGIADEYAAMAVAHRQLADQAKP